MPTTTDRKKQRALDLSVVIPVYNEQDNIAPLSERLTKVCRGLKLHYEILFVDDGSTDGTLSAIQRAKSADQNISAL